MSNEILDSTKELLGVPLEETAFDSQLVIYISAAFQTLGQLVKGLNYHITLAEGDLDDISKTDTDVLSLIQMYIFLKVRLMFDPPTTQFVLKALQDQIAEYEGRLLDYEIT